MNDLDDSLLLDEVLTTPRNIDAEQGVLCGILNQPELIASAIGLLKPEHFYTTAHAEIYRAMADCFERQAPIDPVTLGEALRVAGKLEQVGGASYLYELLIGANPNAQVMNDYSLRYYGRMLIDLSVRRNAIHAGHQLVESAQDISNAAYLSEAENLLFVLAESQTDQRQQSVDHLAQALAQIEEMATACNGVTGLSTGFPTLDATTHGFQPWQLITVSARPGGGKSAFALNVAMHVLTQERRPVLYISLEMTGAELMRRLINAVAGSDTDLEKQRKATAHLHQYEANMLIEDAGGQTLAAIQSRILRAKKQRPDLALIIVDHIGLIASEPKSRQQNRAYEIQEITGRLKMLAKTVQVPVMELAQMNRGIEGRQEKKPMLSDLRDSGSIEMDSDIVLFTNIDRHDDRRPSGTASISIAKQRDGVQMDIPMLFVPHLTRFKERFL